EGYECRQPGVRQHPSLPNEHRQEDEEILAPLLRARRFDERIEHAALTLKLPLDVEVSLCALAKIGRSVDDDGAARGAPDFKVGVLIAGIDKAPRKRLGELARLVHRFQIDLTV